MKILGIETSCDETAAAVWIGDRLGSNIIASQDVHKLYGGVVPELASRAHVRLIWPLVARALEEAQVSKTELDGIATTYGPGLAGALLVGLNFAKGLALALRLPFIGINHIEGHIFSNSVLDQGPVPPFLSLIISGGHTQLVLVKAWGTYEILGKTRDDAAGEAFDKVAKMLELSYPGGPAIDRLARDGDPAYVTFPKGRFKDTPLDFSYSGLKTAVLYHLKSLTSEEKGRRKADIAASFQEAAVQVLVDRSLLALESCGLNQLALAGGVACNSLLRQKLQNASQANDFQLFIPPPVLCTDNAAMIARTGKFYLEAGVTSDFGLSPRPSLRLG
ncbi:MAG: tRNA (adenosine(37)-N6)-threonylcarbamoyltransferase complex transferase subunit TsaD [bacterium]